MASSPEYLSFELFIFLRAVRNTWLDVERKRHSAEGWCLSFNPKTQKIDKLKYGCQSLAWNASFMVDSDAFWTKTIVEEFDVFNVWPYASFSNFRSSSDTNDTREVPTALVIKYGIYCYNRIENMVRALVLALALASASAFAPVATNNQGSALSAKPIEKEIGVLPPIGYFE